VPDDELLGDAIRSLMKSWPAGLPGGYHRAYEAEGCNHFDTVCTLVRCSAPGYNALYPDKVWSSLEYLVAEGRFDFPDDVVRLARKRLGPMAPAVAR
jgi:hypothetical protein